MGTTILILLVLAGALIQVISLFIVRNIVKTIPIKKNEWKILGICVMFFFFGYIAYAVTLWTGHDFISGDTITSIIFFLGACFVLLVTYMSRDSITALQELTNLQKDVITDPLMGIYNRRFLDRQIEHEFNISCRHNIPFSIALIDVDHFKSFNDNYGHHIGDLVLKRLAEILKHNLRRSDYVGRFGGEEILIILPGTNKDGAMMLTEKLREIIASSPLIKAQEVCFDKDLFCTVSIGVATFDFTKHKHFKDLINDADVAMYEAKCAGRNRVCQAC